MKKTVLMSVTAASVLVTPLFAAELRYAYDERRQLTGVVRDGREAFGYGYDQAGNLLWASIGCKTNVYEDVNWNKVKWVRVPGRYNDCVMRKAVDRVKPRQYSALEDKEKGLSQYNCQDYADDLRREYKKLISDKKIRCECGLKDGQWR